MIRCWNCGHLVLDGAGKVQQRITLLANHDDTTNVGLDATNHDDCIQTAVYSWYDTAHRLTDTASYGTGTSSWTYAALTARPGSVQRGATRCWSPATPLVQFRGISPGVARHIVRRIVD